jgi:hypothetical protein
MIRSHTSDPPFDSTFSSNREQLLLLAITYSFTPLSDLTFLLNFFFFFGECVTGLVIVEFVPLITHPFILYLSPHLFTNSTQNLTLMFVFAGLL